MDVGEIYVTVLLLSFGFGFGGENQLILSLEVESIQTLFGMPLSSLKILPRIFT